MSAVRQTKRREQRQGREECKRLYPQPRQIEFLKSSADITIFGGSAGGGKTYALLMEPLRHIDNPNFGTVIFRRNYTEIEGEGALWDSSMLLYGPMVNPPTPVKGKLEWTFSSGARVSFRHLQYDETTSGYLGAQIPLLMFDQLETFTEYQFFYMLARNRSTCGVRPYTRATANPCAGWLARFLDWWIAEDGYADLSRSGKIRWMLRERGLIRWASSIEELCRLYGRNKVYSESGNLLAKSVTFIVSTLADNPALRKANPEYEGNLNSLSEVERARLLGDTRRGGNWHIVKGGNIFKREWFEIVDALPADITRWVRYWDDAATKVSEESADPDWTSGCKMGEKNGVFYIADMRHLRDGPKECEAVLKQAASEDGRMCPIVFEQEPGSASIRMVSIYQRTVLKGYTVLSDKVTEDKLRRAGPFQNAASAGNVKLLRGPWNKDFLDELESFSADCDHDDQEDTANGAHRWLTTPNAFETEEGETGAV